jgi:hypothetical protein
MDVIAAYREVGSYRGAAEICGTTHKTVKRIIEAHDAGNPPVKREPRPKNYDQVADLVAEKVKATSGRISAKRLLPLVRAAGYAGSDRNFRRLVAVAKKAWRRERPRGRRPAVWAPGETLVIDWGVLVGLHVSARCRLGRDSGSSGSPLTRRQPPRWRCWPSASRFWVGSPVTSPTNWPLTLGSC